MVKVKIVQLESGNYLATLIVMGLVEMIAEGISPFDAKRIVYAKWLMAKEDEQAACVWG